MDKQRTFAVPLLLLPNLFVPDLAVGKCQWDANRCYANETYHDLIAQGTYQYGLTNDITLNNSGLTTSSKYTAGLAGVALTRRLGNCI